MDENEMTAAAAAAAVKKKGDKGASRYDVSIGGGGHGKWTC